MSYLTQKFEAVSFLLQWKRGCIGGSKKFKRGGVNFDALAFPGDSLMTPSTAMLAPVVTCLMVSA